MQIALNQILFKPGQTVLLQNVAWDSFECLLDELGENRATRVAYSDGLLEIMAPSALHESDKEIIGDLVKILLEASGLEFWALGSTTFKNQRMGKAVEPDACFYVANEAAVRGKAKVDLQTDPPPDLAIEIDTRTRFDHYEKLGVPELWRYDGEHLEINLLEDKRYVAVEDSRLLPGFRVKQVIPEFLEKCRCEGRSRSMKYFRLKVQNQVVHDV